jgi:hypothetical protein
MDAAHYLAELTRLIAYAQLMPEGVKIQDSHGCLWAVINSKEGIGIFHASDEKAVSMTAHGDRVMFHVGDLI